MSRERKFRGLTKDGKWVYGNLIKAIYKGSFVTAIQEEIDDESVSIYESLPTHVIFDSRTICQYIGIKDCNGKKIYVADIVEDNFGDRYEVVFEDYKFNLKDFYCGCFDNPNDGFSELRDKLKVIGNIFEDGDLMEEK